MIHEVDEAIRRLLAENGVPSDGGELSFDAPTRDWTARRNAPTVDVFLYDIREDMARRRTGTTEILDEQGMVVGWQDPPRWYQLSYLVTAWTNRPADEHRLLSAVLACLSRVDSLAAGLLTGTLAELGLAVGVETAGAVSEGRAATDVWSALGGELKPAVDLRVTAPMAGARVDAGPLVTEGVVLQATTPDVRTDDDRHLRYEGTSAQGTGFAATRPAPDVPVRRRRRVGS